MAITCPPAAIDIPYVGDWTPSEATVKDWVRRHGNGLGPAPEQDPQKTGPLDILRPRGKRFGRRKRRQDRCWSYPLMELTMGSKAPTPKPTPAKPEEPVPPTPAPPPKR